MKLFLSFIAMSAGIASALSWDQEVDVVDLARMDMTTTFGEWKEAFGRDYASITEEYERFGTFVKNMQFIASHNSDSSHGAKLRANQFADLTRDEFASYVARGYHGKDGETTKPKYTIGGERNVAPLGSDGSDGNPTSVDWTTQGVVTPVKNQGQCGSCWAFSATGSTECRVAIATGTLTSLSEQQLVDCSQAEGNQGCNGGLMDSAFQYMEKEGGLCSEAEYAYRGVDGTCKASSCGTKYDKISSYTDVATDSSSSLETATVAGCVSVAIQANQAAFQFYSSGILDGSCGTRLDHGVLVVGYGVQGSQKYWKVKNSWGTSWGEQGYVLICKECNKNGNKGECGILEEPSFPISA